ncbi:serine/threonine kinase [Aureococcus anophagefferens]|nr:serine/threonine kinase [Aureococcus anophagefferens]
MIPPHQEGFYTDDVAAANELHKLHEDVVEPVVEQLVQERRSKARDDLKITRGFCQDRLVAALDGRAHEGLEGGRGAGRGRVPRVLDPRLVPARLEILSEVVRRRAAATRTRPPPTTPTDDDDDAGAGPRLHVIDAAFTLHDDPDVDVQARWRGAPEVRGPQGGASAFRVLRGRASCLAQDPLRKKMVDSADAIARAVGQIEAHARATESEPNEFSGRNLEASAGRAVVARLSRNIGLRPSVYLSFKAARKKPGELLDRADTNRSEERDTLSRDLGLAVDEYLATTGEHFHDAFHPIRQARNFFGFSSASLSGRGDEGAAEDATDVKPGGAKRKAAPAAKGKATAAARRQRQGQGAPAAKGKATPAAKGKATPAAKGKATPAAKGKATPAAKGKAPAAKGDASAKGAARRPRTAKRPRAGIPPGRRPRPTRKPRPRPRQPRKRGKSNHVDSSDLTPGILIAVNIGKRGPTSTFVFPRLKQAVVLYHGDTLVFDSKEAHCLAQRPAAARPRRTGTAALAVPDAPTAVVLGEAYDAASLSVAWQPPFLDGGATISAYRVEIDSSAGFDFHGDDYRVDEVAFVHEVQTVTTHFRAAESQRRGTFTLSWGGKTTAHLDHDASADEVADAVSRLTGVWDVGVPPVRVTRSRAARGYAWRVQFVGVYGNVGLLTADDSYLIGDDARIEVEEVTEGYCDVVSGGFSYEVQTVQVDALSTVSGSFKLSFEGQETASIAADARDRAHTLTQGAQDASLMVSDTADLSPSSTAEVVITERIKGADAFRYAFDGLDAGKEYFARVTAYNSAGYGPCRPSRRRRRARSRASGHRRRRRRLRHALDVTWTPPNDDGGAPVLGYDIEWYSEETQDEVQVVTLSASDGAAEIQSVTTEADTDGLSGYFTLELRGETTEIISVDAPAEGEGSVKTALERLSSSGEIEVSRDYSSRVVRGVSVAAGEGKGFIEVSKGAFHQTGSSRLDQNDLVFVAGEQFRVRQIDYGAGRLELGSLDDFTTPAYFAGANVTDAPLTTWAFGYEWTVTFAGLVGEQPPRRQGGGPLGGTSPVLKVERPLRQAPLKGTFALGFEGDATPPLSHDATAADVEAALEQLSTITDADTNQGSLEATMDALDADLASVVPTFDISWDITDCGSAEGVNFCQLGFMIDADGVGVNVTRTREIVGDVQAGDGSGTSCASCTGVYHVEYRVTFTGRHHRGNVPSIALTTSSALSTYSSTYGGYTAVSGSDTIGYLSSCCDSTCSSSCPDELGPVYLDDQVTVKKGDWVRLGTTSDSYYEVDKVYGDGSYQANVSFATAYAGSTAVLTDAEVGVFYSDPSSDDGVSSACATSRVRSTDVINVDASAATWSSTLRSVATIESASDYLVVTAAKPLPGNGSYVGLYVDVEFLAQHGDLKPMVCDTSYLTASSDATSAYCNVTTLQDGSLADGDFSLTTYWPNERVAKPSPFNATGLRWNSPSDTMDAVMERVGAGDGVSLAFGLVDVSRSAYTPSTDTRWSGGYAWTVTFLQGTTPAVVNEVLRTGSTPFSGTFSVAFNGAKTEEMEWQEAADEVEYVIEKLDTIGDKVQLEFERPLSDGGTNLSHYLIEYDTSDTFSSPKVFDVSASERLGGGVEPDGPRGRAGPRHVLFDRSALSGPFFLTVSASDGVAETHSVIYYFVVRGSAASTARRRLVGVRTLNGVSSFRSPGADARAAHGEFRFPSVRLVAARP